MPFRLQTAMTLLNQVGDIVGRLGEVAFPFYILNGKEDLVCPVSGVNDMLERSKTDAKYKGARVFPDCLHCLTHEPDVFEDYCAAAVRWMGKRVEEQGGDFSGVEGGVEEWRKRKGM